MSYKIRSNSILTLACVLSLLIFFSACSDDDDPDVQGPENRRTGFVVRGLTSSNNAVAKYFEEVPTGMVDLSDGVDFISFFPQAVNNGALFSARLDGSSGISKVVVNDMGEFIEQGVIPLSGSSVLAVKDSTIAVVSDGSNSDVLTVFDPTTFEVNTSIDLSAAPVPDGAAQAYLNFSFREDNVFLTAYSASEGPFTDLILHQVNLASNSYIGDTKRMGNGLGVILRHDVTGNGFIDAANNLYIPDGGNVEGAGLSARLNQIPAGSNEIDPNYVFEPSITLNPQTALYPIFKTTTPLESGKVVALVNSKVPQEVFAIIAAAGGMSGLTAQDFAQIASAIFSAETLVWCEIDVIAKAVTPIDGIPAVVPSSSGKVFEHNGNVYLPSFTLSGNEYYEWNPATGAVSLAFTITGADIPSVWNLASNTN